MDNSKCFGSFGLGFFVASILMVLFLVLPMDKVSLKYYAAIDRCEINLPRTQFCKIVGVVDDKPK